MNRELFGVFGGRDAFDAVSPASAFERVLAGPTLTVGLREADVAGTAAQVHRNDGLCVLWGEAYVPGPDPPAAWLLAEYRRRGPAAFDDLNGSYLAVLDTGRGAVVATDPIRSRECFYTDRTPARAFGTDPVRLGGLLPDPSVDDHALRQFLLAGTVVGDATLLDGVERLPFDACLTGSGTEQLSRFVYHPERFDYVAELAARLERALARRTGTPGRTGLLLSGGYDSRTVLASGADVDVCFTIDTPESGEASVARRVADQYGVPHRSFPVDDRYLNVSPGVVQYTQGVKESVHVHHAGYADQMAVDTMFHGAFFDTVFRGNYLPRDGVDLFGHTMPRYRLEPDPDPGEALLEEFDFRPAGRYFPDGGGPGWDDRRFVEHTLAAYAETHADRYDSIHNGIDLVGLTNAQFTPLRTHLADHFVEPFVAADADLLDWHLRTPPEYRNERTYLAAIRRVDDDVLAHRPPDRPYDSHRANEVEGFLRRTLPLVEEFGTPWPDRERVYERYHGGDLFDRVPAVQGLPVRLKLRINDATTWTSMAADATVLTPAEALGRLQADTPPTRNRP